MFVRLKHPANAPTPIFVTLLGMVMFIRGHPRGWCAVVLNVYACFAADGHWHKAAVNDPRHDGSKMAVGHFYALNLRTHTLRHLAAGEGLHEHDMSALKRIKPKGLP